MKDKIIVNVSSFNRKETLIKSVMSIYNQCDVINVYLNGYDSVPKELSNDTKIKIFRTNNERGDAYKFDQLKNSEGYYLTIDDDIIYSDGYVKKIINAIEKYERKNIITLHGRFYNSFPIESYYGNVTSVYHCAHDLVKDVNVQVGGTGVMGFHTDLFKVDLNYFETPNMADVWIAALAKKNLINITCIEHKKGDVVLQSTKDSIFDKHHRKDEKQTKVINHAYNTKKLSIVIPTKGHVDYLKECVKSVLSNIGNDHNYEVLVGIDNCEDTLRSLNDLPNDYRLNYYYFPTNVGPYVIRNSLAEIADSNLIFFFDSDDVLLNGSLSNIMKKNQDFDIMKIGYQNFSNEESIDYLKLEQRSKNIGEGVFLVKKNKFMTVRGFENWFIAADSDFHIRAKIQGLKTVSVPGNTFFARRLHPDSLTQKDSSGYKSNLRKGYVEIMTKRPKNFLLPDYYNSPFEDLRLQSKLIINPFDKIKNELNQKIIEETNRLLKLKEEKSVKKDFVVNLLEANKNITKIKEINNVRYIEVDDSLPVNNVKRSYYKDAITKVTRTHLFFPSQQTSRYSSKRFRE